MIVTTLDWQPVEVQGNIALTTVWVPHVPWAIDTTFEQGSGFDWPPSQILTDQNYYYIIWWQTAFSSYNNNIAVSPNKIAPFFRVNKTTLLPDNDTILWTNFNISAAGLSFWKWSFCAINWNNIYCFWRFTTYQWETAVHLAVIDKTTMKLVLWNTWVWIWASSLANRNIFFAWNKIILPFSSWRTYNGSASYSAHIVNPNDLTRDWTLTPFINPTGEIRRVITQADWKILFVWAFTNIAWIAINRIVRFNSDWTLDSTFNTNVWSWAWWTINDVIELSNWDIVLTWDFTTFNWWSTQRIIVLNNNWTTKHLMASGLDSSWLSLTNDSSDNIYVSWFFSTVAWSNRTVAKLSSSLVLDWTFNPTITSTWALNIDTCQIVDNNLIIVWTFSSVNWTAVNNIVKIDTNTWAVLSDFYWWVNKWLAQVWLKQILVDWNYIYFASSTNFATYADNRFYDWEAINSTVILNYKWVINTAFSKYVSTSWTYTIYWILNNWNLFTYWDNASYHILNTRINKFSNLKLDYGFIVSWFTNNSSFNSIVVDNWYIIWWTFTSPKNRIVKLDTNLSVDASFDVWTWFWKTVQHITKLQSWKYLVSWAFTTYKWVTQNRIAILNTDWSLDSSFVVWTWPNGTVKHMQLQDWNLLIRGNAQITWSLTSWKWVACNRLIKVSLTWDIIPFLTNNINSTISNVIEYNNKIYVSWYFTSDWVNTVNWLACFDLNWTPINIFWTKVWNWWVNDIAIDNDWKLVAVWWFTTYDWQSVGRIVRIFI